MFIRPSHFVKLTTESAISLETCLEISHKRNKIARHVFKFLMTIGSCKKEREVKITPYTKFGGFFTVVSSASRSHA
jgi:hypothetical protein